MCSICKFENEMSAFPFFLAFQLLSNDKSTEKISCKRFNSANLQMERNLPRLCCFVLPLTEDFKVFALGEEEAKYNRLN